ncbi:uncharacterized protein LOC109594677 [Aethina tumida]|uniref:uncharacterized protein LOC109594677 n=1 Tax=Aethina tumida TaxID=116153 RepID=UPI0021479078|nr:uncharacterized protein LOC109594677 [Aethina tumida]
MKITEKMRNINHSNPNSYKNCCAVTDSYKEIKRLCDNEYACCLKCLDCGDDKECSSPHISLLPIIDCQPTRHEKPVCFQFYYAKDKKVYRGCQLILKSTPDINSQCYAFERKYGDGVGQSLLSCKICDYNTCNNTPFNLRNFLPRS